MDVNMVIGLIAVILLLGVLLSKLYSPAQYKQLTELYYEQKRCDDIVYEGITTSRFKRVWFKLTNKGVNHYYG